MKECMLYPIPEIDREDVDKLHKEVWAGSARDGVQNSVEINDTGQQQERQQGSCSTISRELRISEARYEDLLSETDEVYPRYLEKPREILRKSFDLKRIHL